MSESARWFIARSQPGRDAIVADALRNRRYEVYRPLVRRIMPYVERKRVHLRSAFVSMFPSYIFVAEADHGWHKLYTAHGIRTFGPMLLSGDKYATVPQAIIDEIKRTEQALMTETIEKSPPKFAKGDRVEFIGTNNPFKGHFAHIAGLDGDESVVLLMNILGCESRVTVPVAQLAGAA